MENEKRIAASILVIDDEAGMREGCRRALVAAGHSADAAPDLATARDLLGGHDYDLYLLDVMLPDGNGLDFLGTILEHDPKAVCIIITGFGSIEVAVAAVRQGAYDFLSKPFTSDELTMAVNQALEHRRLRAIEVQAQELGRAKEELEKLDQVKSQLMLKVAHELRAPTAAVQSYISLILAGYVSEPETKPILNRVQQRLQEMLDLVTDLLELARLKAVQDQISAPTGPQDIAGIIEEIIELFREQATRKMQTLPVELTNRPTIVANRQHLVQIWTNLVSNAVKYTPEGGRISVRLQSDDDFLLGVVEDSGIGIAEEDMPHLFQEFFRSEQAKASKEIGTGLGLAIVRQIVDSYGGEIKVSSKLGQGSRFAVILPLRPRPVESATLPAVEASTPDTGKRERFSSIGPRSATVPLRPTPAGTHTRGLMLSDEAPSSSSASKG